MAGTVRVRRIDRGQENVGDQIGREVWICDPAHDEPANSLQVPSIEGFERGRIRRDLGHPAVGRRISYLVLLLRLRFQYFLGGECPRVTAPTGRKGKTSSY
jgi:hypothetical protein